MDIRKARFVKLLNENFSQKDVLNIRILCEDEPQGDLTSCINPQYYSDLLKMISHRRANRRTLKCSIRGKE